MVFRHAFSGKENTSQSQISQLLPKSWYKSINMYTWELLYEARMHMHAHDTISIPYNTILYARHWPSVQISTTLVSVFRGPKVTWAITWLWRDESKFKWCCNVQPDPLIILKSIINICSVLSVIILNFP